MSEKKIKNKGTDYTKSQSPKPSPGKLCNKTGVISQSSAFTQFWGADHYRSDTCTVMCQWKSQKNNLTSLNTSNYNKFREKNILHVSSQCQDSVCNSRSHFSIIHILLAVIHNGLPPSKCITGRSAFIRTQLWWVCKWGGLVTCSFGKLLFFVYVYEIFITRLSCRFLS